ncbi:hypothetical protein KIPB_013043 [Kipferlia bialata]|uniref:Uncharacterized protein n=1 Tax=Kipferlia bialata TaxID=797122 RepID=A0A391P8C0_9EUKA|nr:hypothetical protein KIPB_013043 [Kipferlia bialata]|eukprot:g13043.t1
MYPGSSTSMPGDVRKEGRRYGKGPISLHSSCGSESTTCYPMYLIQTQCSGVNTKNAIPPMPLALALSLPLSIYVSMSTDTPLYCMCEEWHCPGRGGWVPSDATELDSLPDH